MSCEMNANKIGRLGGVAAGISAAAGKFSQATGAMLERAGRATAPLSGAALDLVDRRGLLARLARDKVIRGIAAGAALGAITRASRQARLDSGKEARTNPTSSFEDFFGFGGSGEAASIGLAAGVSVQMSTGAIGTLIARATRDEAAGEVNAKKRVMSFWGTPLGETRQKVKLYRSGLTGMLNRADRLGTPYVTGRGVRSGDGVVFETGGVTWHRGTSVVDTPDGKRTITHLQSLALPAAHYYFNQPLDDEQAVNVANRTARPETTPGYVGTVSSLEALTPGWAATKRALITSQLYWGESAGAPPAEKSATPPQIRSSAGELRAKMEKVAGDLTDYQ